MKEKNKMDILELRNDSKQNQNFKNIMEGTNEKSSKTEANIIKIMQFEQQRENRF